MTWAGKYVGLAFREPDFTCWGLVRAVMLEQCSIDIAPFHGIGSWESPRIHEIVAHEIARDDWLEIDRSQVKPFDVALMWVVRRLMGRNTTKSLAHIGIIAPGPRLLHVERETASVCVRLSNPSVAHRS